MRSIPLGLLFVSLAFALDVDSLPVWDPSILEKNALENASETADFVATTDASDSSHAEIETHGYKTMQVTVGDGGTQVDQELRLSIQGRLSDSVYIDALLSDVDRKAGDQTTATLQEVDQIYFRVESPFAVLHLGDFTWEDNSMGLSSFSRSSLGAMATLRYCGSKVSGKASGAWGTDEVTRYSRSFSGVQGQREGYYLDESAGFISVVPNSEKVWLNGVELVRNRDYEVNYAGGLLNFKNGIIPGSDDVISVEYDAYLDDDIYTMYAVRGSLRMENLFFDVSGFHLENDVERMRKSTLDSADYELLKNDRGENLGAGSSLQELHRPKMSERLGARLRLQAEHRFYADVELGLNRMDSNTVSDDVGGPSGRAFRWFVTSDSTQNLQAFPVALSVYGNFVQEGFAISEFSGSDRDWDAYALRNEWDLDSALLKGDLRHDELALRIRLGKDWFGTAKWGYRRGDDEKWNSSRSQLSLVHRNLDAMSEFTASYVSSVQNVEQKRYQGTFSSEFLRGFFRPFGNGDVRYSVVDSLGNKSERGYAKTAFGASLNEDLWNVRESVGTLTVRKHDMKKGEGWRDSVNSVTWTQSAEANFRKFNLSHLLQYSHAVSDSLGASDSWVGDLNTNFGDDDMGLQGSVAYRFGMTSEQTYTAIYKAVAKGTGDVRYDSLTGAFIEGVDNGDFVYEGMGRNDSVGAVLSSNASLEASLEWNPGVSLGINQGLLRDITLSASYHSEAEDTTGKKIYFPPVVPAGLKSVTAGTVSWEATLAWDHPSGVMAQYNPSALYEKKMSSIGYYQDIFDHKISAGLKINEDHYIGIDNVFESVNLTALQRLNWNIWDISGKYTWKLPAGFRLEPRIRYREGSGEDDLKSSFGAYLWEEEIRVGYEKEGLVDGHVSFASIQMNERDGEIPYQMMSGFSDGVTYRLETMVSVEVNNFLSLSLRYILRFGDAEENVFQKLSSEAKAYF
ncbi:hypothetical protein [Fibrobacter sp. UWB12]|uniref:hypothetical protein n=1 Tax=Fibrobacter sp. UWB12 TaxID=1896203 RepID=UPI000922BAFE|nr:hypothetical protein [Fibrobacter sp. UWB12]SHK63672.1 hypothetical protein SAMN05720759_104299 [Fibrobacter sp. UWB12]